MGKAIGIDLGATNSVACYFDGRAARVLLNSQQEELTPSVVGCEVFAQGEPAVLHVGRSAVNQAKLYPRDTVFAVKRLMGRRFDDERVRRWGEKVGYEIVEANEPNQGLAAVMMGDKQYLPEEISALIVKEIKRYSEAELGDEVTHAVITVPAYFGAAQRAATLEAGHLAGLTVTLLPDPVAAAIAFGHQAPNSEDRNLLLVYDMGGSTFDISIISRVGDRYHVLEINGDQFLGGDDFDAAICLLILQAVKTKDNVDLADDPRFLVTVRAAAEQAKKSLSSPATDAAFIAIPEAACVGGKDVNIRLKVTRQEFEDAIRPAVEKSRTLVLNSLTRQGLTPEMISDVLLVGGSTAVPLVRRMLADVFGEAKLRRQINPMHCVAIGAAIMAHQMQGIAGPKASSPAASVPLQQMEVTEISVHNLGIQVVSESGAQQFDVLVHRGEPLPMSAPRRRTFCTAEEGQSHIRVPIYEGPDATVSQNSLIGVIECELPPGLPKGHPIHLEFYLARDATIHVSVYVPDLDLRREVVLQRGGTEAWEQEVGHEDWPGASSRSEMRTGQEAERELLPNAGTEIEEQQKALAYLDMRLSWVRRFVRSYDVILTALQKTRLNQAISEAQQILNVENATAAVTACANLERLLSACDTAFLIELARVTAQAADMDTARRLNQFADELFRSCQTGDLGRVNSLREPLSNLIRHVHRMRNVVEELLDSSVLKDRSHGSTKSVSSPPITDAVQFSLTAPTMLVPNNSYILDVWAHLTTQRAMVLEMAREVRPAEPIGIQSVAAVPVERGAALQVVLKVPDFGGRPVKRTLHWNGDVGNARFPVKVPAGQRQGRYLGTVTVRAEGLRIATLEFDIVVGSQEQAAAALPLRERRARTAFASYAREDIAAVGGRIQGMKKMCPDLDIFWDVTSMRSGELWPERLKKEICRRDTFYLFWSIAASKSAWVEQEWRLAFQQRGIGCIDPVPLVSPREAPPPKELGDHLHFDDWELAFQRWGG